MKYSSIFIRCDRKLKLAFEQFILLLKEQLNKDRIAYDEALEILLQNHPLGREALNRIKKFF